MNRKTLVRLASGFLLLLGATTVQAQSSAYFQAVTNLNPLAYWPLQETVAPPVADVEINLGSLGAVANAFYSSTNVNKGAAGIPSGDSDPAVSLASGLSGGFLAVPLTGSGVTLPVGAFTVEAWVYPTNTSASTIVGQTGVVGSGGLNGGANSAGWSLNLGYSPMLNQPAPGTVVFHVNNGSGAAGGVEASFTQSGFAINNWYHIVAVYNGSTAVVYVNGVAGQTSSAMVGAQAQDTWDPLTIGCGRGLNNNRFGGSLDEVAIYTHALSSGSVTAHYNAGNGGGNYASTVLSDSPYMYWRMDAPAYTAPVTTAFPVAVNYGSSANLNGLYLPGTTPGLSGPTNAPLGSPSYACAFNGLGTDATNNGLAIYSNGVPYAVSVASSGILITNLDPLLNTASNNFTVAVWFKANPADSRFQGMLGHGDSSWRVAYNQNGKIQFNPGMGGDTTSFGAYNDGNWHQLVCVYNNSGVAASPVGWMATNYVYVDGTLSASALVTNLASVTSSTNVLIGGAPDYAPSGNGNVYRNRFFSGSLAQAAYFTNALSSAQVASLFVAAGGVPLPVITGQPITGRTNSPGTGNNGSGPGSYIYEGVIASGATSYQWYFNSSSNYSGATLLTDGAKYSFSATPQVTITNLVDGDSGYYYVVVGNSFGSVTSILASITVYTQPFISQTPAGGTLSLYQNQGYTLSVSTIGETNFTYQWLTNGIADTTAGTASTYPLTGVQTSMSGSTYQCVVTNPGGSATNALVTLSVLPLPAALTSSAYSSSLLALAPSGYWPMHEVAAAAPGDVETNLGVLGNLANGYYADWATPANAQTNIYHQVPGALVGDSDPAVMFNNNPDNGTPGYLMIPRTSPATTLRGPFSIEAWVQPENTGFGDLVSIGPWNANNGGVQSANRAGFRLCWGANGFSTTLTSTFEVFVGSGTGTGNASSTDNTQQSIGKWYHLVLVTADNTNWTLYVNGNQQLTFVLPMGIDTSDPILVGQGLWATTGPGRGFLGAIDEVAIYTNALQQSDVSTHYNDGINGPVGQYKSDVLSLNPIVYLRMNGPAYTPPPVSAWPVLTNYGIAGGNGVYSPGTMPGSIAGPPAGGISASKNVMIGNGMSSFADAGSSAAFNPTGATAFSFGAWFKGNPGDERAFQTIIGRSDSSFRAAINSAGKLQAHGGSADVTSPAIYNDGFWHQFILTYTGTNVTYNSTNTGAIGISTLYVDGVQVGQSNGGANAGAPTLDLMIGDDPQYTNNPIGTGRSLAGQVCEAAFWNGVTLSSNQVVNLFNASAELPTITTQPVSAIVNAASAFTNKVTALGSSPLAYQWYRNNQPLPVGGQLNLPNGATSPMLVINPVQPSDASTDYYVVITNYGGAVTSSVVTLTVNTLPVFTNQPVLITQTNTINLFAGATPAFTVATVGATPTYYRWFTNGVLATTNGITLTSYTLPPEVFGGGVTNFYCVASNFVGQATNTPISVNVLAAPTAPYPAAVLAATPIGYWRLNEPDDNLGDGDAGVIADDYWGGDNGIYTNAALGQTGYSQTTDPATTSANFGQSTFNDSGAFTINGVNFAAPTNTSATFSIEAWVNGYAPGKTEEGIVAKGYGGGGEQFALGVVSTGFRFFVRTASGTSYVVVSPLTPGYGAWHHLVGVCDEANGVVNLYVDGLLSASTAIPPLSGINNLGQAYPMTIGSRSSSLAAAAGGTNDLQFSGNVNDVAVYNYALSASQVAAQYSSADLPPYLTQLPGNGVTNSGSAALVLPALAVGTPPIGYSWYDQNGGTNIISGVTNSVPLNATLTVANVPGNWNGDTLVLTVTNAYGTTNYSILLDIVTNPPVIIQDLPSQVISVAGKAYNYTIGVTGPQPYGYQWYNGSTPIAGQTGSAYLFTPVGSGSGTYSVVVSNIYGVVTSSVSSFTTVPQLTNPYATNLLQLVGSGPVGYWPLQETNAPAPANIETNYGSLGALGTAYYAATNASVVSFDQSGALTAIGDNDSAVGFNGNGTSYAFVPRVSPALTLRPPFTLETWVNSSSTTFSDLIGEGGSGFDSAAAAGNYGGFRMSYGGNNGGGPNLQDYVYYVGGGVNYNDAGTPAGSLTFGQWHHCVTTYDGTNALIYLDGQLQGQLPTTMTIDTWSPLTFGTGRWQGSGTRGYTGDMDEVAMYTNLLSASQVSNHYLSGTTAGSNYMQTVLGDNPLLYYRMDNAAYTNVSASACPVAVNYGLAPINGAYLPGTVPGQVAGPNEPGLGGTNDVALPVNGVFSCVDAGTDPTFNPTGTQPFTALAWFKANPADGRLQTIMGHGTNWSLNLDATNGTVAWTTIGAVVSTNLLNDGNWHMVAGVFGGTTSSLYVDGQLNKSASVSGSLTNDSADHLYLGGNSAYNEVGINEQYFAGSIMQAAFYTNALTAVQVQQIYTAAVGSAVTPTVSIQASGANVVITYTGTLVSAPNVTGPYTPVTGASSPYTTPATNAQVFYRAHQ